MAEYPKYKVNCNLPQNYMRNKHYDVVNPKVLLWQQVSLKCKDFAIKLLKGNFVFQKKEKNLHHMRYLLETRANRHKTDKNTKSKLSLLKAIRCTCLSFNEPFRKKLLWNSRSIDAHEKTHYTKRECTTESTTCQKEQNFTDWIGIKILVNCKSKYSMATK